MPTNERSIRISSWLADGDLLLEHAILREELGKPFEFQLDLLSKRDDIAVGEALWKPITITVDLPGGGSRLFHGLVTRFVAGETRGEYSRYRATLRPWLWLLSRISDCRIFQKMTVPDVIKQVFRDRGFSDFDDRLSETYRTWEYLVQYRESDLNFVSRVMEQEGIYCYFEHDEDKHTLVLADAQSGHDTFAGYETVTYLPPETMAGGVRGDVEHITSWHLARQIQPLAHSVNDFNFETPRASLRSTLQASDDEDGAEYEIYDYPGEFKDADEAQVAVKLGLQERRADVERENGGGNARGLATGCLFTMEGHPRDDQNKEYLVVSTTYALTPNLFESGTPAHGPEVHCSFVAMDSHRQFRSARKTPKPMVQGPQTALVVGEQGEEITTDKYGRVKVQFHWDREGKHDQDSSCWVRVAQVWAGAGWGAMHIPRIGQEVIVEFLEGDPDRPIITGRVYNADNMPPYTLPDNKTQSGIKSRSTKDGGPTNFNEIRFEDKKGSEELHIQAERDQSTHVKRNQSISVDGDRNVSVGGNEGTSVTGTRTATITKKETQTFLDARAMTVAHENSEEITGKDTETFHGGRDVTVESGDTLTVVGSDKTDKIHGNYDVTADTSFQVTQKSNRLLIQDSVTIESVGDIDIKNNGCEVSAQNAGSLLITATQTIQLKCGPATITLNMDGTIELDGVTGISATAGTSSLVLDPSGAAVKGTSVQVSGTAGVVVQAPIIKVG
jgi:type VI secretion system secreted protein VgrG